jgi:hypothetical protein
MNVASINNFIANSPPPPASAQPSSEVPEFSNPLARASAEARQAAEQFVATAFVMPMLAAMRDDPFKSELFHGGFTEDAFGQQLDTQLADQIVRRMSQPVADVHGRNQAGVSQFDLIDTIHRRVMQRMEGIHRAAEELGRDVSPTFLKRIDLRG